MEEKFYGSLALLRKNDNATMTASRWIFQQMLGGIAYARINEAFVIRK